MVTVQPVVPRSHQSRPLSWWPWREAAVVLAGLVALSYVGVAVMIRDAEVAASSTLDLTWPAYVFLAALYFAGAVTLALTSAQWVAGLGLAVQVVVLGLFVVFGVGLLGPGLFDEPAFSDLPLVPVTATVCTLQVLLAACLGLSLAAPSQAASADGVGVTAHPR